MRDKVALVGAGVGVTPLRALLEDLAPGVDVVVVQRASTGEQLIHRAELREIVDARRGRLLELVGSREVHRLDDPGYLQQLIPDAAARDLYVCGPAAFAAGVASAAEALGVPPEAVHREAFEF